MGQTTGSFFISMDSMCEDGGTEELDSQLLQIRQRLLTAIRLGSDCSSPLMDLLYLSCPVTMKYAVLNVKDILQRNNQTVQNLRNIPVALNILEKYGRHLIKPKSVRNELWRYVKFSNPIFRDRVDPLQGGRELMKAMGYTKEIEDGLFFPEPLEPDINRTANMVADIILAKKEMEMYLSGNHPQPQAIEKFLPSNIVSDVEMLRVGVSMNDLCPPSTQTSAPFVHPSTPHHHLPEGGMAPPDVQSNPEAEEGEQMTMKLCDICGDQAATKLCKSCDYKLLCTPCDQMWHNHPRRQNHMRNTTSLSHVSVNQQQTETIQGPYGIQARPARDTGHHPKTMTPIAAASPNISKDTTNSQEPLPPSMSPKLKNLPRLDSLVPSHTSSGDVLGNSVSGALPPFRPSLPPQQMLRQFSPDFQQATGLPQYVEPVSVYFPPESITQPSSSVPVHSSSTQGNDVQRSDSLASSKLIAKIKAERNPEKQLAKCDIHIMSLAEEIEDIEEKVKHLIEINETFWEGEEFMKLSKKKGLLTKEKILLEKFRRELVPASSAESSVGSVPAPHMIYTPPHPALGEVHGQQAYSNQPPRTPHLPSAFPAPVYQGEMGSPTDTNSLIDENIYYTTVGQARPTQPTQRQQFHSNIASYSTTGYRQQYSDPQYCVRTPQISQAEMHAAEKTTIQQAVTKVSTSHTPLDTKSLAGSEVKHSSKAEVSQKGMLVQSPGTLRASSTTSGAGKEEFPNSGYTQRWQCEHCTMFNDAGTRICGMCHRTSDNPMYVQEVVNSSGRDSMEETVMLTSADKATSTPSVGLKIAQEQDQVYLEKQQAHRQYQEQLQKQEAHHSDREQLENEAEGQPKIGSSKHFPPAFHSETLVQSAVQSPKENSDQQAEEMAFSSGSSGQATQQATFQQTMEIINEQRHVKKTQLDGADLLQIIKMADREGFDVEEVVVALEHCERDPKAALEWLKTRWDDLVEKVVTMVTNRSQDCEQNNIGILSSQEAKKALQESHGNVEEAVTSCINARLKLYADVNSDVMYARENVLEAMHEYEGDRELVQRHLDMMRLVPFKDRIWKENGSSEPDVMHLPLNPNCSSVSTSVISHQDFQDMVCDNDIDLQRRIRMVLVEARLQSWGRAETVIRILEQDLQGLEAENDYAYTLEDVVEAVRNCQDRRSSVVYLQRECVICMSKFPMTKMMNLNICQCQMCRECLRRHFEISIKEKHVRNWTCPVCSLPDFNDENVSADYLNLLGLMLKTFVDKDIQDLFETKVRDWHLQKDPNFRWCAHCGNGFLYQGWQNGRGQLCMFCQQCKKRTCFLCKKQWEPQHEGLTCEQFEQWKIDNDPNNQAAGLAKLLEESGIDCPDCKMRYSLAKGGCMHFKCPECAHEFCSGCSQPFYKQGACHRYKQCISQGLHCHHPRDCFFYLRDNDVEELQKLLKSGDVPYNTEVSQGPLPTTCPVMEQKDADMGGRLDEACGKEVEAGHAGLCCIHYKEYLVGLINRRKLDPVIIMSHEQMQRLVIRMDLPEQKKKEKESQSQFKKRLLGFIKQNVPLKR